MSKTLRDTQKSLHNVKHVLQHSQKAVKLKVLTADDDTGLFTRKKREVASPQLSQLLRSSAIKDDFSDKPKMPNAQII